MSAVRIIARLRPPLAGEVVDDRIGVVYGDSENKENHSSTLGPGITVSKDNSSQHYPFHSAYDPSQNTRDLFQRDIQPLLDQVFSGATESVTVFAYGVTSSGKTFTMQGDDFEDKGIIGLAVEEVFKRPSVQTSRQKLQILSTVSAGTTSNAPTFSFGTSIHLPHLSIHPVPSIRAFLTLYANAAKNRSTGATLLNKRSSRSHAVLTLYVSGSHLSKIHLLDLAGSENNNLTGNNPERMKESSAINKSLTALGQVVSALNDNARTIARARKDVSDPKLKLKLVPYRSSALTRLLSDALNGTSLSALIVCLAPSIKLRSDLVRSVGFASQARRIERTIDNKSGTTLPTRKTFDFKLPFATSSGTTKPESLPAALQAPKSLNRSPRKSPMKTRKRRASLIPIPVPQLSKGSGRASGIGGSSLTGRSSLPLDAGAGFVMTEEEIQERISKAVQIEVERTLEKLRQEGLGVLGIVKQEGEQEVDKDGRVKEEGADEQQQVMHGVQKQATADDDLLVDNSFDGNEHSASTFLTRVDPKVELEDDVKGITAYEERIENDVMGTLYEEEDEEEEVDQLIDEGDEHAVDINVGLPPSPASAALPSRPSPPISSTLPSHSSGAMAASPLGTSSEEVGISGLLRSSSVAPIPMSNSFLTSTPTPSVSSSSSSASTSKGGKRKARGSGGPIPSPTEFTVRKRRRIGADSEPDREPAVAAGFGQRDDVKHRRVSTGPSDVSAQMVSRSRASASKAQLARAWLLQAWQAERDRKDLPQALAFYRRAASFTPENGRLKEIITRIEQAVETNAPLPPSPKRSSASPPTLKGKKRMKKSTFTSTWLSSAKTGAVAASSLHARSASKESEKLKPILDDDGKCEQAEYPNLQEQEVGVNTKAKLKKGDNNRNNGKGKGKARAVSVSLSEGGIDQLDQVEDDGEWEVPPSAYAHLGLRRPGSDPDIDGTSSSGSGSCSGMDAGSVSASAGSSPGASLPYISPPSPTATSGMAPESISELETQSTKSLQSSSSPPPTVPPPPPIIHLNPTPVTATEVDDDTRTDVDGSDQMDLDEIDEVAGVLENAKDIDRGSSVDPSGKEPRMALDNELPAIKEEESEFSLEVPIGNDEVTGSEWEESPKKKKIKKKSTTAKSSSKSRSKEKAKKSKSAKVVSERDALVSESQEGQVQEVHKGDSPKRKMRYVYGSSDEEERREEVFVRSAGAPVKKKRLNPDRRRNKKILSSGIDS